MATLTYDPTPANEPEFNEAEQEALAIGEAAAQEEQAAYAGKFKDAEELEKAYIELQKKLGEQDGTQGEGELRDEEQASEEEVEDASEAQSLIMNASTEWAETGQLSPETMEQFQSMSSQELVETYMEMQAALPTQASPDFSESDVNAIKNYAGGEDAYSELVSWASDNLDSSDVEAFDEIINSGSLSAVKLAVTGLMNMYEQQNGYDGEMLTGTGAREQLDVFESQAQVVEAMSDPRYDRDPAYRQAVFNKLSRSNIEY